MEQHSPVAERWLPVIGYEGLYEVSDLGRVRSLDRPRRYKNGRLIRPFKGKVLTPGVDSIGRLAVNLTKDGKPRSVRVHRLVLLAFVGPPPEGMEGCHEDGEPSNNKLGNLYWGTRSENIYDAVEHGTHHAVARRRCPLGHLLVEPNLRGYIADQGRRGCLACKRAQSAQGYALKIGRPFDLKAAADSRYVRIMAGLAPERRRSPLTA